MSLQARAAFPNWAQETARWEGLLLRVWHRPGQPPSTLPAPQAGTVVDCLAENKPAGLCVLEKEIGV